MDHRLESGATLLHQTLKRFVRGVLIAAFALAFSSHAAEAQLLQRSLVLTDARIVTMAGPTLEKGSILVKGGRISEIGAKVDAPFLARHLKLAGKTVTPGFIDAWSSLGHTGSVGQSGPTGDVWDSFNRYARDDFRQALQQGVTTIYLAPGGPPGVGGRGVVVQLRPQSGGAAGAVLVEDAALSINIGSGQSPIKRLKTFKKVRADFRKALDYRQSLEDYEEDLKEYIEKLEERSKKKDEAGSDGDDQKNGDKKNGEKPAKDKPSPKPDEDKPDEGDGDALNSGSLWASFQPVKSGKNGDGGGKDKDDGNGKDSGDDKKSDDKDDEDEIKKPEKPSPDRTSEVLLRAIDRELTVRIEAHRTSDMLNALDLAEEFNLDIILEGATEAYLMADRLAEAEVPVILGRVTRSGVFVNDEYRRHSASNPAALTKAGVRWTVASGAADSQAARFVGLNAQVAAGRAGVDWMKTVTIDAARILGISRRAGRLARGMAADFVVWSGDPSDPGSIVEQVYIGGKLAYQAKGQ